MGKAHNVAAIAELTQRIKALEASISRLAVERYPETIYLQQVSGVGPITSLYFVLKVGNPGRFQRTRDIGSFLGLCPKRDGPTHRVRMEARSTARREKCEMNFRNNLTTFSWAWLRDPVGVLSR